MSVKKKLIICGAVIFGVLAMINILWFSTIWRRYNGYKEKMGSSIEETEGVENRYQLTGDKYVLSIKQPSYLRFTGGGFIRVNDTIPYTVTTDENGNKYSNKEVDIVIYIWPNFWGKYKIGIQFMEENGTMMSTAILDKDLQLLPDDDMDIAYNEKMETLLEKYHDEIKGMFDFAADTLELDI